MTEELQKTNAEMEEPEEAREKGIIVIFRFILVPLILVGIVVFLIVIFGQMALKEKSVKDYLYDIRTGSESERWQAAYHLSNMLASPSKDYRSEARKQIPEMILIFEQQGADPRIRRYMATALGSLQDPRAVPPLQKSLDDTDTQTVIFSMWALGNIGDKSSVPEIIERLDNSDAAVRMMSAYVLGAIGDARAIAPLQGRLTDESAEVSWNAAIALSRMHDPAGADILKKLMTRDYLNSFPQLTEQKKEELLTNAITASRKLNDPQLDAQIKLLSTSDPNLRVRDAALKAFP